MTIWVKAREGEHIDDLLRRFKKKCGEENVLAKYKEREFYISKGAINYRKKRDLEHKRKMAQLKEKNPHRKKFTTINTTEVIANKENVRIETPKPQPVVLDPSKAPKTILMDKSKYKRFDRLANEKPPYKRR